LTLLHVLLDLQKKAPINFTIAAATVDPQTSSFDPRPLIPYMKALGVEYHYLSEPIIERAKVRGASVTAVWQGSRG
jgi:tRNA 2-thiocytidine biosynthesis protein TtcA